MTTVLKDTVSTDALASLTTIPESIRQILVRRGLTSVTAVEAFCNPRYEDRYDPMLLNDMERAVARVARAIDAGERVAIFSDYDCDGIPGAVVLRDFFDEVGHENVVHYIPHRHYEGFGMRAEAMEKLHADGVTLIITVDCGTVDTDAHAAAAALGIDVIVTDHHEPNGADLSNAYAVVNPKVGDTYPFTDLCGAAVAFKLVEALIASNAYAIPEGREKWWLDMVGIATIADMVPLTGENRIFAWYGLTVLRKSRRPGLQQLLKEARVPQRNLSEDDIGFTIGPRINAASRMDTPEDALHMLIARDIASAGAYVTHLERLNNERKGVVAAMSKELHKRLKEITDIPDVIVLGKNDWRPALLGLAANSIAAHYDRPVFLWGRDGNGALKGSCRSNGSVSVIALMEGAAPCFAEYGGHHMSGGFTVLPEKIFHLSEELNAAHTDPAATAIDVRMEVDAVLELSDINDRFLRALFSLAPFGMGNEKPLFAFRNVTIDTVSAFGKTKEHVRVSFQDAGVIKEAIAFFHTPESFTHSPTPGGTCTIHGHIEHSYFRGREETRIRIIDIVEK